MKLYQDEFHPTTIDQSKAYYAAIIRGYLADGLSVDAIVAKGHTRALVESVAGTPETCVCMACGGRGVVYTRFGNDGCSPDEDWCNSCRGTGRVPVAHTASKAS